MLFIYIVQPFCPPLPTDASVLTQEKIVKEPALAPENDMHNPSVHDHQDFQANHPHKELCPITRCHLSRAPKTPAFCIQRGDWDAYPLVLKSAPRAFTRLIVPVVAHIRSLGILIVIYLDDILPLHQDPITFTQMFKKGGLPKGLASS